MCVYSLCAAITHNYCTAVLCCQPVDQTLTFHLVVLASSYLAHHHPTTPCSLAAPPFLTRETRHHPETGLLKPCYRWISVVYVLEYPWKIET